MTNNYKMGQKSVAQVPRILRSDLLAHKLHHQHIILTEIMVNRFSKTIKDQMSHIVMKLGMDIMMLPIMLLTLGIRIYLELNTFQNKYIAIICQQKFIHNGLIL